MTDPKASDEKPTTDMPTVSPTDPANSIPDTGHQAEVKPSGAGFLLREDGGRLLSEDGTPMQREGGA